MPWDLLGQSGTAGLNRGGAPQQCILRPDISFPGEHLPIFKAGTNQAHLRTNLHFIG